MPALLAWFAGYLISSAIARFFVGLTFVAISAGLISGFLSSMEGLLNQYAFYNILKLAGVGTFLSVVGGALLFKTTFVWLAKKADA